MIDEQYKKENLKKVLENKKINPKELIAIRVCSSNEINYKNNEIYASPLRPTIHFSLNHFVKENIGGNWKNKDTAILIPFQELIKENKENFYGGTPVDVFCVGYTKLPKKSGIILKKQKNETNENFKERVEEKIEELGYKNLPGGNFSWGDYDKGKEEFRDLLNQMGDYKYDIHNNSIFGETDEKITETLNSKIKSGNDLIESRQRYKKETNEELDPEMQEDREKYSKWFDKNLESKKSKLKINGKNIDGSFLRNTWGDIYSAKLNQIGGSKTEEQDKYQKYIQKWKEHWKNEGL